MSLFESIFRFFGWWIINIDSLFVLLILIGTVFLFLRCKRRGKTLIAGGTAGLVFFAIVPIGLWIFENLENRFPQNKQFPNDAKGIILLGGCFDQMTTMARGERAYNLAAGNLIKFVELAREHPDLQLVYTGNAFEAEQAKETFQALGVNLDRILFEGNSKDTKDNAAKTAELIKPSSDEKWVLVASAYHMPRAMGLFQKNDFNVFPYPVDYHTPGKYEMWFFIGLKMNLDAWHVCSREWLGMTINYILGRSNEFYPGPESLSPPAK